MNFHPIIVHFPVALLSVYSVLELVRFKKVLEQTYWFYIKALFVIFGSLGTVAALLTGDIAAEAIRHDATLRPVVSMHENFADITTIIFGVLAVCYLISWVQRSGILHFEVGSVWEKLWNLLLKIKHLVIETPLVIPLALAGLISVTITGSLGGFMVYGENLDPMIKFVYHLFF
jgi:hypothetical protein